MELARSNTALDRFAYAASHDLVAPLRSPGNVAEWLEEDLGSALTDEARRYLVLMKEQVGLMRKLIRGLLDYARATEQPRIAEAVDTGAMLADVITLLGGREGIRIDVAEDMPVFPAARAPLAQVLRNLIDNAIKHHDQPNGVITVSCRDDGERWSFCVRDDGPGIAPQLHARAFDIFSTLHPPGEAEGAGIGLALVKSIVEAHGGTTELESDGRRGAAFTFTWPKAPAAADGDPPAASSPDDSAAS